MRPISDLSDRAVSIPSEHCAVVSTACLKLSSCHTQMILGGFGVMDVTMHANLTEFPGFIFISPKGVLG